MLQKPKRGFARADREVLRFVGLRQFRFRQLQQLAELEDSLYSLELKLPHDKDLDLVKIGTVCLPPVSDESRMSFLDKRMVFVFNGDALPGWQGPDSDRRLRSASNRALNRSLFQIGPLDGHHITGL